MDLDAETAQAVAEALAMATYEHLRSESESESEAESEPEVPTFGSLDEANVFWSAAAGEEVDAALGAVERDIEPAYRQGVLEFFSDLREAREFRIRPEGFARRVLEALRLLSDNPEARTEMALRMADSVDACSDKPAWALNQLHIVRLTRAARGNRTALRDLGARLLRLQIVHRRALEIAEESGEDDVSVFLQLEIRLQQPLDLPVSAEDMYFPALDPELVEEVYGDALCTTPDDLEEFLASWPEWERQDRLEAAAALDWADLPRARTSFRRSLRNLFGARPSDPVRLRGTECSLTDLLTHWVATGQDLNGAPVSLPALRAGLSRPQRISLPRI